MTSALMDDKNSAMCLDSPIPAKLVDSFKVPPLQVHHLIEKCLIFNMTREECMEALSKHANIQPVVTSTVWKELEKENKEFFEAYAASQSKQDKMSEEETTQIIRNMISDSSEDVDK